MHLSRRPASSQGFTYVMIANVFSVSRFLKLEGLRIKGFRANEWNMRLIASCTRNVTYAAFDPFRSDWQVSAFQFIADSNRRLEGVRIDLEYSRETRRSAGSALESLSELLKMFRKCRKLWLRIWSVDEGEVEKADLIGFYKILPCWYVNTTVCIGDIEYQYPS